MARAPPTVSEAVNAHENIYIDAGKVVYSLPLSSALYLTFSLGFLSHSLNHCALSVVYLLGSSLPSPPPRRSLPPPCALSSFPFRFSSRLPSCSVLLASLFSSTNDGNHPQTHQLTLFQSYRTTLGHLPSRSPHLLFSLSPLARCLKLYAVSCIAQR